MTINFLRTVSHQYKENPNIFEEHDYPLYLYDFDQIEHQFRRLEDFLPDNIQVHWKEVFHS